MAAERNDFVSIRSIKLHEICFVLQRRNRDRKQELEMDWSDKKEADEIDSFCAGLKNGHTCKQFFAGSAKFQEM